MEARYGRLAAGAVPAEGQHFNIEDLGGGGQPHLDGTALQESADLPHLLRSDLGDDLQLPLRLSHRRAGGRGGLDPPEPSGIGYHHALDIFQDIPADIDLHPHRHTAQQIPRHRRGIGHRDGLCAPHGGQQLFLQDLQVSLIPNVRFPHRTHSFLPAPLRAARSALYFITDMTLHTRATARSQTGPGRLF